jgi:alpha-beta hydrolase superfamily lysophospholipase
MENTQIQIYNGHRLATVFHDTGDKKLVIFCHGYRSSTIGPNRFFVRAARKLAEHGISSLRFDQYGSGNSEGDFFDSSFNDWVATTKAIVQDYFSKGYAIALLGQSMGGSAAITAAAESSELTAVVAWVPDASVDEFHPPVSGAIEEGGQIVQASFWQEAHDARVGDQLPKVKAPVYIVQCTADEYVDAANREKLIQNAQPQHTVENFEGYKHSTWTYGQSEDIINKSADFLVKLLLK